MDGSMGIKDNRFVIIRVCNIRKTIANVSIIFEQNKHLDYHLQPIWGK